MSAFSNFIRPEQSLSEAQMIEAMTLIMDGKVSDTDIAAFLIALADRGETVEEITGAAKVLREKAITVTAPYGAVDCCGTGGDASGTYNISTAVALVAAACGVPVAKHGGGASTSKSGSVDVLVELGINLELTPERLEEALKLFNFAFLAAPRHHLAMKNVRDIRKKIARRTIFNLLGPLANPAGTKHQLIGVFAKEWVVPMAEALKNLGTKTAWVVHGSDGLDEITVTGPSFVAVLSKGEITEKQITPEDFGLKTHKAEDLLGGHAEENAAALRALLDGQKGAYRDIVLANTSAVLNIHGTAKDLKAGVAQAAHVIDSGAARRLLRDYIAFSRETENL